MKSEKVNTAVKEHVLSLRKDEWTLSDLGQELYRFAGIFKDTFFHGELSEPVLIIDIDRYLILGSYRVGRNGFGARNQIIINFRHVRSKVEILSTLLHVLIPLWQREITQKTGTLPYHDIEFQHKSSQLGSPTDSSGHTLKLEDPFLSVCTVNGVAFSDPCISPSPQLQAPSSKLKKYSSGCTIVLVAGSNFRAICLNCSKEFV